MTRARQRVQEEARRLAATDVFRSYVITAGAGSGKTTVLVERYLNLIDPRREGGAVASPANVIAITFTTKAAREMLDRIRAKLWEEAEAAQAPDLRGKWLRLIEEMAGSRVQTIHAFCAGLLREFPIEAGVDPEFTVLDEFEAAERLERAARTAVLAALEADDAARRLAVEQGLEGLAADLTRLYRAVRASGRTWDQVEASTRRTLEEGAGESVWLLFRLLRAVDEAYAAEKGVAALDFEDLQLKVRDLLTGQPLVRDRLRSRCRYLLVDEFQDTDALQSQIVHLLAGENPSDRLFLVGDPKQSIYRFRHADVTLFEEWRARLARGQGGVVPLAENFRTQPALVAFVNAFFTRLMGAAFQPLEPARQVPGSCPAVEVLLAEQADGETVGQAALKEARLLAARLKAMVEGGEELVWERPSADEPERRRPVRYGDCAILFRTRGRLKAFEAALAEQGVPYYVLGGIGFYKKQEVRDLISLLRALDDPADGLALAAALRSPLFGLPDDVLLLLVQLHGSLDEGLRRAGEADLAGVDPETGEQVKRAARIVREGRRLRSRLAVTELVDRLLAETGYEATLLASAGGPQKAANVRKLRQMAGEVAAAGQGGLPDFLARFDRLTRKSDEEEAPLENEGGDTVKLLTVHASKGLEFPVVAVADLARPFRKEKEGWRYDRNLGLYPGPAEHDAREARTELVRLLYVAVTRARDHLLLTGITGGTGRQGESWLQWILGALDELDLPEGTVTVERSVTAPAATSLPEPDDLPLPNRWLAESPPPEAPAFLPLIHPVAWPGRAVAVTTVSELMCYAACPRRYHLQYRLGTPPARGWEGPGSEDAWRGATGGEPLPPDVRGSVVHRVIARLRDPAELDFLLGEALAETGLRAEEREGAAERLRPLLAKYVAAEEFAAVQQGLILQAEAPFFVRLAPGLLLHGAVDRVDKTPGGLRLLDFKTNFVSAELAREEAVGYYWLQLPLYALAVEAAWRQPVVSAAYVFLAPGLTIEADVSPTARDKALREAARLSRESETGGRSPAPGDTCRRCGYVPLCDAGRRIMDQAREEA
ncbi:MAG: UvrD-helicase domain-containing protein [Bacillota bacterium]|nr:UvrD-helicase domain-containing protein [Bacillota bacterium]